jgi:hypothetical protein
MSIKDRYPRLHKMKYIGKSKENENQDKRKEGRNKTPVTPLVSGNKFKENVKRNLEAVQSKQ